MRTGTILDRIVEGKRRELARSQVEVPLAELERRIAEQAPALDFKAALRGERVRLIAEVKRASPSKGMLRPDFDPIQLAETYAQNGAAAISVLTEANYFQGSLDHLAAIRRRVNKPLLHKDFIVHPYQVYESRAFGADALLLIVAILSDEDLWELLALSSQLGMQCLVEVHSQAELQRALHTDAGIIGINNRSLRTFEVDISITERLRPLIPSDRIVVSESGIRSGSDMGKLSRWRVDAALVGEFLVTANDVAARVRELT
jgi:indole-3-glycerol phosphate synthase